MDTARQFLRYSIPGSIFLLSFIMMQIAWNIALGASVRIATQSISSGIVLAVLAAGLPIGFILYQLYFGAYRAFAWTRWPGPMPRRDRGGEVLQRLTCRQRYALHRRTGLRFDHRPAVEDRSGHLLSIRPLALTADFHLRTECDGPDCKELCRKAFPDYSGMDLFAAYRARWGDNWHVVMMAADAYGDDNRFTAMKREYTNLSDIYHALGVCRVALAISFATWFSYNVAYNGHSIGARAGHFTLVSLAALALVGVISLFLSAARRQTQQAMLIRFGVTLRALLPTTS